MRRSISAGTSAGAAAAFTHGVVLSAVSFNEPLPISTYQGFFWHIVSAVERLWSYVHGWQSMSHVRDFGWFFAPTSQVICPLIGFALFWTISRYTVGRNLWKPVAIALLAAIPSGYIDLVPGHALPWIEAARTMLIVLLMVWSVGSLRLYGPDTATTQGLATA
jgi:hypothetical protein